MMDDDSAFEVHTSDPYEQDILEMPTSDPYEEVIIPGFSQRDETREEVEMLIDSFYEKDRRRRIRRAEIEAAAERVQQASHLVHSVSRPPSPSPAVVTKRTRVSDDRIDLDVDFDLLQMRCSDLEEERDEAQTQISHLGAEIARLQAELQQYKVSGAFFRKETGRWRWAAAFASTCLDKAMRQFGEMMDEASSARMHSAMHDFGRKMVEISDILGNPDRE